MWHFLGKWNPPAAVGPGLSTHQSAVTPSLMVTHSPTPLPSSHSFTPGSYPRIRSLYVCLPFWYFPHISSPFPYIPFHYYLYSPNEWDHIMFVLLRLTYFTQHNTLQFHPRWSKWWVFVISNGWVICRKHFGTNSSMSINEPRWFFFFSFFCSTVHYCPWCNSFSPAVVHICGIKKECDLEQQSPCCLS